VLQTCGVGQLGQFVEFAVEMRQTQVDPHQDHRPRLGGGRVGSVCQSGIKHSGQDRRQRRLR
jgi:hypothetical protein